MTNRLIGTNYGDNRGRRWRAWVLAVALTLAVGAMLVLLTTRQVYSDRFAFLQGRAPTDVFVGRINSGPFDAEGFEARVYSWKADTGTTMEMVDRELVAKGFCSKNRGADFKEWQGVAMLIDVSAAKAFTENSPPDHNWTTVVCSTPLRDGLWTKWRLLVQSWLDWPAKDHLARRS